MLGYTENVQGVCLSVCLSVCLVSQVSYILGIHIHCYGTHTYRSYILVHTTYLPYLAIRILLWTLVQKMRHFCLSRYVNVQ